MRTVRGSVLRLCFVRPAGLSPPFMATLSSASLTTSRSPDGLADGRTEARVTHHSRNLCSTSSCDPSSASCANSQLNGDRHNDPDRLRNSYSRQFSHFMHGNGSYHL